MNQAGTTPVMQAAPARLTRRVGSATVPRCKGSLHDFTDVAFATDRTDEPGQHRPGDAGGALPSQPHCIGSATVPRRKGSLRDFTDFASATDRANEPGRHRPSDAGGALSNRPRRVGPATVPRCVRSLHDFPDFASTARRDIRNHRFRPREPGAGHRRGATPAHQPHRHPQPAAFTLRGFVPSILGSTAIAPPGASRDAT